MKKLNAIIFTVFLNLAFFSCTPAALQDDTETAQECCGTEGGVNPPPGANTGG